MNEKYQIIKNRAQCLKCGTIIESLSTHHFVQCKCRDIFVDGGFAYLRRGAINFKYFKDLSVTKPLIRKYKKRFNLFMWLKQALKLINK
jgi:hypothetical protein